MEHQPQPRQERLLDVSEFIAATKSGNKDYFRDLSSEAISNLIEQTPARINIEEIMLKTPSEMIFEHLLLANDRVKPSPDSTSAIELLHSGLSLRLPLRRIIRLLMLQERVPGKLFSDVLHVAFDHERPDLASFALPFFKDEDELTLRASEWLINFTFPQPGKDVLLSDEHAQKISESLLDAAQKGNARLLRILFRRRNLACFAADESNFDIRLMTAAIESGNREVQEIVFAFTSIDRATWCALDYRFHAYRGAHDGISSPLKKLVTTRSAVSTFREQISVMDKDTVQRTERMLSENFGENSYLRELGRPVKPELLEPLKNEFPLFAELIKDFQARSSLLCRVEQVTALPQSMSLPNTLLVGKPGWGKTYFIHRLGEVLGLPFHALQMSSVTAGFIISGCDSSWSQSRPGKIHDVLVKGKKLNPLFLLDEIDKMGSDSRFPADGALYQLLEPEHARTFRDECLSYPIDASHINWFATANLLDKVNPALASRFEVFEIPEASPEIAWQTARSVYRESLNRSPWKSLFEAEPDDNVVALLAHHSPREAHRHLQKAFGCASLAGRAHLKTSDFNQPMEANKRRIGFVR